MKLTGCDLCGVVEGSGTSIHTFFICTGRFCDAAGSMDDAGDNVDVCGHCAVRLLGDIIKERNYDRNTKILKRIKRN